MKFTKQTYNVEFIPEFERFERLAKISDRLVGFNSISFDDKLCHANELNVETNSVKKKLEFIANNRENRLRPVEKNSI